jgi:hypothetical protein
MLSVVIAWVLALAHGAHEDLSDQGDNLVLLQTQVHVIERASLQRSENVNEGVDAALDGKGPVRRRRRTRRRRTPSPTPAPTTTTTTTTAALELIDLVGKLTNNNLGNFGPTTGDANIKYSSVTSSGVDLVVTSNRGEAFKQDFNGLKPSTGLGRISQKSGNSYEYNFAFQNSGSPAAVPKFVFTVFDVDANVHQEIKETVTVCGAAAILLTPTTRLTATRGDDECWSITPTMISASDNVQSLSGLSDVQKDHAFSALFNDASSFIVRASLTASAKKTENRALLFSFTDVEGLVVDQSQKEVSQAPPQTCDEVSLAKFAGKKFEVSQTSTYHGYATYTYRIEIGGDIVQQTSNAGNYLIGRHESYSGKREIFGNGDRCGSTPRRATVTYTFGSDMRLLSANEPSMCVYEYAVQLPETDCAVLR